MTSNVARHRILPSEWQVRLQGILGMESHLLIDNKIARHFRHIIYPPEWQVRFQGVLGIESHLLNGK